MRVTRTISLELLRHGPWHNQLLSPLTQYIALCGNHQAETVTMLLEHQQLLTRLRALNYRDSDQTRVLQLEDMAQLVTQIVDQVRGLAADLSCDCNAVPGRSTVDPASTAPRS